MAAVTMMMAAVTMGEGMMTSPTTSITGVAAPALIPGTLISHYRLTEFLGEGGFAVVWSAWDTRLQRLVAIKIIEREDEDSETTLLFTREAQVIASLDHPFVLPLHDFGETPHYRYLVMRYATAGSLATLLTRTPLLPLTEAFRLASVIAEALDAVHGRSIVHRDLKPGNILLDAQGLPYLSDFGLAKVITPGSATQHTAAGTLNFMAPEQLLGGAISTKADIYAFGVMLYMLLTGSLPFNGHVGLSMRQMRDGKDVSLPDVTEANAALPAALNDILRRMTDLDPLKRPDSATNAVKEIAEGLRNAGLVDGQAVAFDISQAADATLSRAREIRAMIKNALVPWSASRFALSLTQFVLLDEQLRPERGSLSSAERSLMLRGAFEFNIHVPDWWQVNSDSERLDVCWRVLTQSGPTRMVLVTRVLGWMAALMTPDGWALFRADPQAAQIGVLLRERLDDSPASAQIALNFVSAALPVSETWQAGEPEWRLIDRRLPTLATDDPASPLAPQATQIIAAKRRTNAVVELAAHPEGMGALLTIFEQVRSLPSALPLRQRLTMLVRLGVAQLGREPSASLIALLMAALGGVLAWCLLIYIAFSSNATDPLGTAVWRNTVGFGLPFGLVMGVGVWLARHVPSRLFILSAWQRSLLGLVTGGLVVAVAFAIFHSLVYDDQIDPMLALGAGLTYVAGFAVSVRWHGASQVVLGAMGVVLALLVPWSWYVAGGALPPFEFDIFAPDTAYPQGMIAALVQSLTTIIPTFLTRRGTQKSAAAPTATAPSSRQPASVRVTKPQSAHPTILVDMPLASASGDTTANPQKKA